jgi:hypothetical protein
MLAQQGSAHQPGMESTGTARIACRGQEKEWSRREERDKDADDAQAEED